ncbi:hypothetical protein [Roseibium aggregatum]|uniref:Uncharacterized protein n=1 Tax=Roseibium aggregatum TaxID=187304 RepID=A0A926S3Y1_9HYPH|nr:hypothetical protein [Roseibium aggregatum]MBD1544821.1 hypothetical protein [Roseibium aggregatum]
MNQERVSFEFTHLTEVILSAEKAGCAPWCGSTTSASQHSQRAKSPGPSGGEKRTIGSVAPLARCAASRFTTRLAEWIAFRHQMGEFK